MAFLISGMITFGNTITVETAPVQEMTVAEAKYEVYDTLSEMSLNFERARKENQKLIKGSDLELIKLMEQGDQVVKSPWGSQQFGTTYTYNDWGARYKGRGGKENLTIYKRDNDLTKYVFDKSKHYYGATHLNIPRNQEPNSMTINPANVYNPYSPYGVDRLNDINELKPVAYDPVIYTSNGVNTGTQTYTYSQSRTHTTPVASGAANTYWGQGAGSSLRGRSYTPDYTFSSTDYKSYNGWDSNTASYNNGRDISGPYHNQANVTQNIAKIGGSGWGSMASMWNGRNLTTTQTNTDYNDIRETAAWFNPSTSWSSSVQYHNLNGAATSDVTPGANDTNPYFTPGPGIVDGNTAYQSNGSTGYDYIYERGYDWWTGRWDWINQSVTNRALYDYYSTTDKTANIMGSGVTYNTIPVTGPAPMTGIYTATIVSSNGTGATAEAAKLNALQNYINSQLTANWATWTAAWNSYGEEYSRSSGYRETLIYAPSNININYTNAYIGDNNPGGSFAYIGAGGGGSGVTANMDAVRVWLRNGGTKGNAAYVVSSNAQPTLTFKNGSYIYGTSNDIGFNIQSHTWDPTKNVSITGNADFTFVGNNNSVYKLNSHINKLTIINGDDAAGAAFGADNLAWGTGAGNFGRIHVRGNNNIVFDALNVTRDDASKIYLSDVQMGGDNNIIIGLQSTNYGGGSGGYFPGEIKIQGAVGGGDMPASSNNIAVLAASAQGAIPFSAYSMAPAGTMSKPVNIKGLNVGFGSKATKGTLVYAVNATQVDVEQDAAIEGGVITDGAEWRDPTGGGGNALNRGYDVKLGATSDSTVIGYAKGGFETIGNTTAADVTSSSTINFKSNVDMVSRNGIVYFAEKGGKVTQGQAAAKDTRAGSYNSVIALAVGTGAGGKNHSAASTVLIKGNITAADHLLFRDDTTYNGLSDAERASAYKNVGAAAIDGGYVLIEGAAAAADSKEDPANAAQSLIYGMGAYASGSNSNRNSKVVVASAITPGSTSASLHIVSGDRGALYATNGGTIEYNGTITHQNNIGNKITDATGTRFGRGRNLTVINDTIGDKDNDHDGIAPFYVHRVGNGNATGSVSDDNAGILFNADTTINMYDGVLLNGNVYGNRYDNSKYALSDYHKVSDVSTISGDDLDKWNMAKYRGMEKVTAKILSDGVTIGVINQAEKTINWTTDKAGAAGTGVAAPGANFLSGIGAYAGGMKIDNTPKHLVDVTLINSKLNIEDNINIENIEHTGATANPTTDKNDTFNDIKMESVLVTNDSKDITGDATQRDLKDSKGNTNYQLNNVGLSMANSLWRWDNPSDKNPTWRKSKKDESGFKNFGTVNVWGGAKDNRIIGLLANFGTIQNGDGASKPGVVKVDHGTAVMATDGSVIQNLKGSEIIATGKYVKPATNPPTQGINANRPDDQKPAGENYGIVGISDGYVGYNYADLNAGSGVDNSIAIKHEDAMIYVEGDQAVGIYAENRNDGNSDGIVIDYINTAVGTTGIDVRNENVTSDSARGIGIALVNSNTNYANNSATAGGVINLTGGNGTLGTWAAAGTPGTPSGTVLALGGNDIATTKNGIGIYAESAVINLLSDNFTVETKDNGVGMWLTDDSIVAEGANHQKTFQYNYNGANNKNGFAMAFTGRNIQNTVARNDLDIKFNNVSDGAVDLAYELAETAAATPTPNRGTYKGIAGILVDTNDAGDRVVNYGNIEEDTSKTHVRAYGAVVNKGGLINYGDIKLNDSLNADANTVTSDDIKKANVGIFANSRNKLDTLIENHGDITIGDSTNDKNVGSWAIYGYNVNTGGKLDGSKSLITINKNNFGVYSGDGHVNMVNTKLKVGNDTVLGHIQTTSGTSTEPGAYPITRQTAYANPANLFSKLDTPRELDSAVGVYIDKGTIERNINISADMDIDRFSYGIVFAEKNGGPNTNVTIGSATDAPKIRLAYSTASNPGGQVRSRDPRDNGNGTLLNKKLPEVIKEQGNAVYYYSADTASNATSYADITMDGDYNTAYYTKGSVTNFGNIDLRSQYDLNQGNADTLGFGNVGIFSSNTKNASINKGTIVTGMSDTDNMMYSAAMAAGRNVYKTNGTFDSTREEGYIVNEGTIRVQEKEGIGMYATGAGSKAVNKGLIELVGDSSIGMYLDRGATGINEVTGVIKGSAQNLKGVVAVNGGYIKNYGKIEVLGTGSYGIVTDGSRFLVDPATGNVKEILKPTDPRFTSADAVTAGQTNDDAQKNMYGGTESSIEEGTAGNPKTTGVGTTIVAPDIVPLTKVYVDGVDTPIFNVETDATNPGDWGETIAIRSSIQTGGTRIIDLSQKDEYGRNVWDKYRTNQMSEVTSIGMYVDTSGVRYTNPIDGIQYLPNLGKVDLYFGTEAAMYTNSKAIRIGDHVDANGTVTKSNMLKPFNDALSKLPGGARINPLSASLTWEVLAKIDDNNQLSEVYMSKVPYHSFAFDDDTSLVNFTNNLDNIYEIAVQHSNEKRIFNKLNSLGNGEGHILAQAFDQMRGHIYGGVQQRTKATSDIVSSEINNLFNDWNNASKDSNKFKVFGGRNEFKTDTPGLPDWESNYGGVAYVHEDETVRLGEKSGWYAGVINNYYEFIDLDKSSENQAMIKAGMFKQTPFDYNGEFTWSIAAEGFVGRTDTNRKYWVIDESFKAYSDYYTYGGAIKNELAKSFRINKGFNIKPYVGVDVEYGRYTNIHEKGDMALDVKSDDYLSIKPRVGVTFAYKQPVIKKTNLLAELDFSYENEIGKLNDVENKARINGAWTDYYTIKGDKEDKRGNFKSEARIGLDNGRLGFTVNAGYDTKGDNFKAGFGIRAIY